MGAMLNDSEFLGRGRSVVGGAAAPAVLSDDEFLKKQTQPTQQVSGIDMLRAINRGAGSAATGANDAITTALGFPVDAMTAGVNQGASWVDALAGTNLGQIQHPVGGSESLRSLLAGTIGRTDPEGVGEKLLYGAGAGLGSAAALPLGAAAGASRAPLLAKALIEPAAAAPKTMTALGGISGLGSAAGSEGAGALTPNPVVQELAGLAGGLAAPLGAVGAMTVPAVARGAADLIRPMRDAGQRQIAGRILNESSTFGAASESQPPLGINPTLGQATNDPGLLALERVVTEGSTPQAQGFLANHAGENSNAVRQAFNEIGSAQNRSPEQISQDTATRLDAIRQAARGDERAAWEQIDPERQTAVPIQPLRDAYENYIGGLSAARRRFVPDDYAEVLRNFRDSEPMVEVQDLRSMLTNQERQARRSGDYNQANVLRGLDEALFQRLPENAAPMPSNLDQAATLRYQTALDRSRAYNETFNQGDIRDIFRLGTHGADATPDSAVLPRMLASGRGQPERVGQFLRAAGDDPEVLQNARDWFSSMMQRAGAGAREEPTGEQALLGNKLRQFVQTNRPLVESGLFTPEQRQVIDDIVTASNMLERTARAGARGSSDTARLLMGNNYLSALVGEWAKSATELVPKALGGAAGFMYGGPAGFVGGAYGAGQVGDRVLSAAYGRARANVTNLLMDAVRDPDFARELMLRAPTAREPANASTKMRGYLSTVPLTLETINMHRGLSRGEQ